MTTAVQIGLATLYLGDNRAIVPTLPRPAALISDPPYGQKIKANVHVNKSLNRYATDYPPIKGDDQPFDPRPWLEVSDIIILWGAHRFAHSLPPVSWLIWDKRKPPGLSQGDGEAAALLRFTPPPSNARAAPAAPDAAGVASHQAVSLERVVHRTGARAGLRAPAKNRPRPSDAEAGGHNGVVHRTSEDRARRIDPGPLDGRGQHRNRRRSARASVHRYRDRAAILRSGLPPHRPVPGPALATPGRS